MHVKGFLHKLLDSAMHISRVETLGEAVIATLETKELVLTKLGRAIKLPIQERSGIQKVNRLLGNKHLQQEEKIIAKELSHLLIGKSSAPWLIVDWTKYPNYAEAVLRVSLVAEGRALTLYEECHPLKRMGNRKVENNFLKKLKSILPENCKPIIITDGGFQIPWFKAVLALDWDYVGRVRGL